MYVTYFLSGSEGLGLLAAKAPADVLLLTPLTVAACCQSCLLLLVAALLLAAEAVAAHSGP